MAFPAMVLLARLGKGKAIEKHPWACYLPERLQQGTAGKPWSGAAPGVPLDFDVAEDSVVRTGSDSASSVQSGASAPRLAGRVWRLSRDPVGCREVQHALECAPDDEARVAIASELKGHVWEALHCPHANHVLQKCLTTMHPSDFSFIFEEVVNRDPIAAAQHKYGCRIVKRLLEHGLEHHKQYLIEVLLANACALAKHPYGTFVIQHLFLHIGDGARQRRLAQVLETNVRALAADSHGCAVLNAALAGGLGPDDRLALARAMLEQPGLITGMACIRHGHLAAQELLKVLEGSDREVARHELARKAGQLCASRYGRSLAALVGSEVAGRANMRTMVALRNAGA